ncbi:MAG: hypothetical protein BMS9Abin12_0448 [Acidimicrobiia bacterium]|nr:MAG: hypothetical protein BMS9Abin12_0448 [Acidimicrobiia bacterium]
MLWYNNPEGVMAIHDGRCGSMIDEGNRLMRLVRSQSQDADR